MIVVGNAVLSDDLVENDFVCNLLKCKGACCEEGDEGAPLTDDEVSLIHNEYPKIAPFLSNEGKAFISENGMVTKDSEGDWVTSTIKGRACVFAVKDLSGVWKCGIEKAYRAGETPFLKPISCHLYPIRITEYAEYSALNYHRWQICKPACENGKALGVPVYKFLKEPLTRRFGADWYQNLEEIVNERNGHSQ